MSEFVKIPNLPQNDISLCCASPDSEGLYSLKERGIRVISPDPCSDLPDEISRHSDCMFCHTGENRVFVSSSCPQTGRMLEKEGFIVSEAEKLGSLYPKDCILNVAVSETFAVGNFSAADRGLTEELKSLGKNLLHVKQGYSKCSVCVVGINAFITEDESIASALGEAEADVCLIEKGDVFLSEIHYGFFGGAAGKISENVLAVNGELKYHKNEKQIREFLSLHGVSVFEIKQGRITDIGGIIPLKEY